VRRPEQNQDFTEPCGYAPLGLGLRRKLQIERVDLAQKSKSTNRLYAITGLRWNVSQTA